MRNRVYIQVVLILMLVAVLSATQARADHARDREYQVKAAFVYNFIKFVDWSGEKTSDKDKPITIGVVGSSNFGKAFGPIKGKQVKGRNIVIKQFEAVDKIEGYRKYNDSRWKERIKALRECQVLFVCSSEYEKAEVPVEVLKALEGSGVLVTGEMPGFLEKGGIVNFVMEKQKVRFEINMAAANRNGLKIRSQLLKLARRVIKEEGKKSKAIKS